MRATILGALGAVFVFASGHSPAAQADGLDYGPQASLFLSYAFGAPASRHVDTGLRYGFQLDHERRQRIAGDTSPLLRWEFRRAGFDQVRIAGVPVAGRELVLNADDGPLDFVKENFGPIALTVAGAVLLYAAVDGESNSGNRDPGDIDGPGSEDNQEDEFCNDRPPFC